MMMKIISIAATLLVAGLVAGLVASCEPASEDVPAGPHDAILSKIDLPPGFKIAVFAEIPNARSLAIDPDSATVFVGQRLDSIYTARDTDGDNVADETVQRINGLRAPNGVAVRDGSLFVALNHKIVRWPVPKSPDTRLSRLDLEDIFTDLSPRPHHGWRYMKFGPDGMLYLTVGAPCNICQPPDRTGIILRLNPDGSGAEIVARGIRNSVGLDWHPRTGTLFFTDNGADDMGDDIPADELNRVDQVGQHFGFPYLGGRAVKLPGFESAAPLRPMFAPVIEFQAHTASLGIHFYRGEMFPAEYRGDAFVAQHGSWNRTAPVGYRIMRIIFDDDGTATGKEIFADGWMTAEGAVGRPVDITEQAGRIAPRLRRFCRAHLPHLVRRIGGSRPAQNSMRGL